MRNHSTHLPLQLASVAAAVALFGLTACSSPAGTDSGPSADFTPGVVDKSLSGATITVMTPPWASFPADELAKFTDQTGIEVEMQTLDWDAIQNKVVTTSAAGQSPADVVEIDWTWVSQFGAAGWFTNLDDYLSKDTIADSIGADTFVTGGNRIGVPYNLDFRGTELNMTMLQKAGITEAPTTMDEVLTAAQAVKDAGIAQYPIGVPLKVVESTSTPFYSLVRSAGGQILDESGAPAFTDGSAASDVLTFYRQGVERGLIDPASTGLDDVGVADNFKAGQSAILIAAGPGQNASFTADDSTVKDDDLSFVHTPGSENADGPTIGLQEGLGIPKASKQKEAAAMFITWWLQAPQLIYSYESPDMGNLPPSKAALEELSSSGKLAGADTVLKLADTVQPVIPGGAPTWYSKFSAATAATIQAVATGEQPVDAALKDLATQTADIAKAE